MEENPLQVMFDNETDPARRTLLEVWPLLTTT